MNRKIKLMIFIFKEKEQFIKIRNSILSLEFFALDFLEHTKKYEKNEIIIFPIYSLLLGFFFSKEALKE